MSERDLRFGTYSSKFEVIENRDKTKTVRKISLQALKSLDEPRITLLRALSITPQPRLMAPEGFNAVEGQVLDEFYPYVESGTLDDQRHHMHELLSAGKIPEAPLVEMMRQLTEAAEYIHSLGYIHADIRPTNIAIGGTLSEPSLLLFDYNSLRRPYVQSSPVNSWHTEYPPELEEPDVIIDYRFDVYSIGRIFYEITHDFDGNIYKHLDPKHCLFKAIAAATEPHSTRPRDALALRSLLDV